VRWCGLNYGGFDSADSIFNFICLMILYDEKIFVTL